MLAILRVLLIIVLIYGLVVGAFFALMLQPPERFGSVMSMITRVPGLFLIIPFKQLWLLARDGDLEAGDPAPDFELPLLGEDGSLRLSSFRGQNPVVLVFGSYT